MFDCLFGRKGWLDGWEEATGGKEEEEEQLSQGSACDGKLSEGGAGDAIMMACEKIALRERFGR